MLSADEGGDCLGGHRHISVKFGVSARSGCFIKSAITTITYYAAPLCAALRVLLVCLSVRLSLPYGLVTRKQKKNCTKTQIGIDISQRTSK